MISSELRDIVNNIEELCDYMETYVTDVNDEKLSDTAKNELIEYLCKLALADDAVVMSEIKFINELFNTSYNLMEIKKMGREYDDTGAYIIPTVIEKACEFDIENDNQQMKAAQTIVNAFYFIGIEFIACDDDVATSEIKVLTEFVQNYQAYLCDSNVAGEACNVIEDLKSRNYLNSVGGKTIIKAVKADTEKISLYQKEDKISQLISEINKEKYQKVKGSLLALINHIRVRQLREQRGLKNTAIPQTMVLFGGESNEVESVADIVAEIFNLEGITEEKFITRYTCTDNASAEHMEMTIELARKGNMLIVNADNLSKQEIDKIMNAVKINNHQAILLSGDMNKLISFLEKNRNLNAEFNRSLYLEGINEEIICDIFEYLCVENDYKASNSAKMILKQHFKSNVGKFDPYYIFEIFDRTVTAQNQRIVSVNEMDSDKMVTIIDQDVISGLI